MHGGSTTVASATAETNPARGWLGRAAILCIAVAWVGILAALVATSANPVVLNRTQILAAPYIAQGVWQPGDPAKLTVTRMWKGELSRTKESSATLLIAKPFPVALPPGEVLVPLSPVDTSLTTFQITHGPLLNRGKTSQEGMVVEVRPLVYPATADALAQLAELLPPAPPELDETVRTPTP